MLKKMIELMGEENLMKAAMAVHYIDLKIKLANELEETEDMFFISCLVYGHPDITSDLIRESKEPAIYKLDTLKTANSTMISEGRDFEERKRQLTALNEML